MITQRPLLAAAVLLLVASAALAWVDYPLARACVEAHCGDASLVRLLSAMGNSAWVLVPVGLVLLLRLFGRLQLLADPVVARCRELFWMVVATGFLADLLKGVVARPRPRVWLREGLTDPRFFHWFDAAWASVPSGHTVTAFTIAILVARWSPRLALPAFAIAAGVAGARVALGAHYASDVLAATALVFVFFGCLRLAPPARPSFERLSPPRGFSEPAC